ncbi:MAG: bifunctional pyr operon transcriptional regulator/uracil phosphoribosyltransferase [Syntrophobacteraceae bacterium CG2_30_61_12]|nr:MAG: bifunctional pyr operon transcriptional regulator/uracil phosphoribosyltransferase [Syntrophobacteraceae bacterium CG2_30_61_12]
MCPQPSRVIMEPQQIHEALERLALEIVEQSGERAKLVLIGIHTGGVFLAQRLRQILKRRFDLNVPIGTLDITLYRDDWSRLHTQPLVRSTNLPFSVEDKEVLLVDDVLFTGRTIRAALDALIDYGRPSRVRVVTLVDRGHRELPICGQFIGQAIDTLPEEQVNVHLAEKDGFDRVVLECRTAA